MLKSLDSFSDTEDSIKSVNQKKKGPQPPPPPPTNKIVIQPKEKILFFKQDDPSVTTPVEDTLKNKKKQVSIQAPDVGVPIEKRTMKTKVKRIVCISDTHCKHYQFLTQGLIPDGDIL
jgi:hypothetical protein